MLRRLRIKFICINMVIVTAMLGLVFGLVLHFTQQSMEQQSVSMMQSIGLNPMQLGRPNERPDEVRLPYFALQIGEHGNLMAAGGGYYDLSDEAFLRELVDKAVSTGEETGVIDEYSLRFCRIAVPNAQCIVFADISAERTTMAQLWRTCLAIGGVSFLAFLLISLLLARWAVKPVDKAWSQQRQFVADASHELKTPLTVIMANAELLQSPDYGENARGQFADNILTESQQMRGLVEGLLDLARVDNGAAGRTMTEVHFSKVVSDAILPFEPVFFEKGLTLEGDVAEGIRLKGSESHLKQVTDILLDNAQKYSSPEGTTRVTLKRQNRNHCLLSVSNQGEAIPPEDLKNIFKRFYRGDKARSGSHSYGLGLAVAQGIVREHHGKIWAESGEGVNTFFVYLPVIGGPAVS